MGPIGGPMLAHIHVADSRLWCRLVNTKSNGSWGLEDRHCPRPPCVLADWGCDFDAENSWGSTPGVLPWLPSHLQFRFLLPSQLIKQVLAIPQAHSWDCCAALYFIYTTQLFSVRYPVCDTNFDLWQVVSAWWESPSWKSHGHQSPEWMLRKGT